MPRHIGIIAVSAEGASLCYETICREGARQMGRHLHPEITMHTLPLARHMEFIESSDREGLARLMLVSARKLINAGAELLICPDNTNHLGYDIAASELNVPWLHIAEEVAMVAYREGYAKLGILGTRFLMESDVYPEKLIARGIGFETPSRQVREQLNSIIFDELVYGDFREESRAYIAEVIGDLQSKGCDAVILGCTELPLIISEADSPVPILDSTRILARAALRESLSVETAKQ